MMNNILYQNTHTITLLFYNHQITNISILSRIFEFYLFRFMNN